MSLRKELLERELSKLGFRRSGASAPSHDGGSAQQQHHPQGGSEHPQAHESGGSHSE